jgi:hypothetical protein
MTLLKHELSDLLTGPHQDLTCDLSGQSILGLSHVSHDSSHNMFNICFDHAHCSDCAVGHTIASDCFSALSSLHDQAVAANDRLSQLVELRERVSEIAASLDVAPNLENAPSSILSGPLSSDTLSTGSITSCHSDDLPHINTVKNTGNNKEGVADKVIIEIYYYIMIRFFVSGR